MLVTLMSQKVNSLTMFANCQLPVVCLQPVEILIVTHFIWIISTTNKRHLSIVLYYNFPSLSKFRLRTNTQGYFRAKWSLRVFQFKLKSIQVALEIKKNPQGVSQAILLTRMPLAHAFSE